MTTHTRCTCHTHTDREPGYVRCAVDHDAIAEQIERCRAALVQCPEFRRAALENESIDEIAEAASGDDALRAINRAVTLYVDSLIARRMSCHSGPYIHDALQLRELITLCHIYSCSPASPAPQRESTTPLPGEADPSTPAADAARMRTTGASAAGSLSEGL